MKTFLEDTICAVSSGSGGAISIVRISGKKSVKILQESFKIKNLQSHRTYYGNFHGIDEVIVTIMLAPKSYTKEDVVEIGCHGGRISANRILGRLLECGARLAFPGEFTKRAFLNGRIDLTQAEAVIDIINAKTNEAQKMAENQLKGRVSEKIKNLRYLLMKVFAQIEASIDYPEDDIEEPTAENVKVSVLSALSEINILINSAEIGEIIKNGITAAIVGRPNVGKSSLLNSLLEFNRVIVSETAGTTRDVVSEEINLGGLVLNISDTAGIRQTDDYIEKIGVRLSKEALEKSQLVIVVMDGSLTLTETDREILKLVSDKKGVIALNKSDLQCMLNFDELKSLCGSKPIVRLSALNNQGIDELKTQIKSLVFVEELSDELSVFSSQRQKSALSAAKKSLNLAIESIDSGFSPDIFVIDIENAYRYLGEIIGESIDEDVVEKIFSEFCLGK